MTRAGAVMKYCVRCVMPDTKKGITFNKNGVCSACLQNEQKQFIDWQARAKELEQLCEKVRGSNGNGYDCIIPVSGGKDSFYQTWIMKHVYRMNVLCVIVVPHLQTKEGISNLNSMVTNLNVDLIKVSLKPNTFREVRRNAFFQRGEPNWADHRTVFSGVARVALLYHVSLVVWGEDIAVEFGGTGGEERGASAENLVENDLLRGSEIGDFYNIQEGFQDLYFYQHPHKDMLKKRNVSSIYLGYYHYWDGYMHYQNAKEFGFKGREAGPLSGNILDYDNIDEKLCEINIWFKFLKFGFWRPTDQCCYQIWNGRMSRQEGVELVNAKQYEFPSEYFKEFLEFHEITESQFWDTAERYRNKEIWHKVEGQWSLRTPLV